MLRPLRHAGCRSVQCYAAVSRVKRYTTTKQSYTVAQLLSSDVAAQVEDYDDQVALNGFVRTVRKQKRVAFAAIGDGTSLDAVQAVLTPEQAANLSTGAALRVIGKWQPSPSGKEQSHELLATHVQVMGGNDAEVRHDTRRFCM